MKLHWIILALAMIIANSAAIHAQATKIAVVNPNKVFTSMKEREDVLRRIEGDVRALVEGAKEKEKSAASLKAELENLKPDSPQYVEKRQQLTRASVSAKMENQFAKMQADSIETSSMLALYEKIADAAEQVAKEKGIDLVLLQVNPELPAGGEGLNINQLRELLIRRSVLYAAPNVDISEDVIARLNANYAGGK